MLKNKNAVSVPISKKTSTNGKSQSRHGIFFLFLTSNFQRCFYLQKFHFGEMICTISNGTREFFQNINTQARSAASCAHSWSGARGQAVLWQTRQATTNHRTRSQRTVQMFVLKVDLIIYIVFIFYIIDGAYFVGNKNY
jgi:hypothetical protein